jgi:methylglutamate dehydrogenase subunit A
VRIHGIDTLEPDGAALRRNAQGSERNGRTYDVVIIAGGGHGLSTAHYLAKEHGVSNVAVIEKGWIGSGNVGRNTTIVRSNYLLPSNMATRPYAAR